MVSPDLSPVPHPGVQGLLGIQDLGQVFFEPIKDKQGNILIVTLKEVKTNQTFESVRWVPICKLQTSRKSVSSPEEPTALDTLLISVQVLSERAGDTGAGSSRHTGAVPHARPALPLLFFLSLSVSARGCAVAGGATRGWTPGSGCSAALPALPSGWEGQGRAPAAKGLVLAAGSSWQEQQSPACRNAAASSTRHKGRRAPRCEGWLTPAVRISSGQAGLPPAEQPCPFPGPLPGLPEALQRRGSDPGAGAGAAPQHLVPREDPLQPQHLQVGLGGHLVFFSASSSPRALVATASCVWTRGSGAAPPLSPVPAKPCLGLEKAEVPLLPPQLPHPLWWLHHMGWNS